MAQSEQTGKDYSLIQWQSHGLSRYLKYEAEKSGAKISTFLTESNYLWCWEFGFGSFIQDRRPNNPLKQKHCVAAVEIIVGSCHSTQLGALLLILPHPALVIRQAKKTADVTSLLTWRLPCKPASFGNSIKLLLTILEVCEPLSLTAPLITAKCWCTFTANVYLSRESSDVDIVAVRRSLCRSG